MRGRSKPCRGNSRMHVSSEEQSILNCSGILRCLQSHADNEQKGDSLLHISSKRKINKISAFELFCCASGFFPQEGLRQQLEQIEMAEHQSMIQPEPMDLSLSDNSTLKRRQAYKIILVTLTMCIQSRQIGEKCLCLYVYKTFSLFFTVYCYYYYYITKERCRQLCL